jgi:hypothetical protein
MTEPPKPRKVSSRSFVAGIALTAVAALMLIGAICWVTPKGYVDFPCFDIQHAECLNGSRILSGGDEADVSQARMFLCISIYLRGFRGGGTIARGPELSDTWSKRDIELARQGETLVVNGQSLARESRSAACASFPVSPCGSLRPPAPRSPIGACSITSWTGKATSGPSMPCTSMAASVRAGSPTRWGRSPWASASGC